MKSAPDLVEGSSAASQQAPGAPGVPPTWGPGRKTAVSTAAGTTSRVWLTLADGNLSEVFFPRLDRPVLHELRFLVAAPGSPPIDDAHEAEHSFVELRPGVPGYTVRSTHAEYTLVKEFLCDPESNAVLISGRFEPELPDVGLFVQASPHFIPGSQGNLATVGNLEPPVLVMQQDDAWIAVVGPFLKGSAGYVNSSDLFVDLYDSDGEMTQAYARAGPGNVAVGAQIGLAGGPFQIALGFAHSRTEAEDVARQALRKGVNRTRQDFERGWLELSDLPRELVRVAGDGGALGRASMTVLRCLEDKGEPGAYIAAPGAPWGESQRDGRHVYHLVWPRDLVHMAGALVDAGDTEAGRRALRYLQRIQRPDGSWPQNCWIDGSEHWRTVELDEVAQPILLAWRLGVSGQLGEDMYEALVKRAAAYIVTHGPATPYDRWEDSGGLSPSTLAACLAALAAAEEFAYDAGDHAAAVHMRAVADYWADRLESWCYDADGQKYLRLAADPDPRASLGGVLGVEFLELVRRGIRPADHPYVLNTLRQVDAVLRAETPRGVAWRRYEGDQYGEHANGAPWDGTGQGRPWPLLAGERAHYSLTAGAGAAEGIQSLEQMAGPELVLPEQVWDAEAIPEFQLRPGEPTRSVAPLGWAHAEYLKLLASVAAGVPQDMVMPARRRYVEGSPRSPAFIWSHEHQITSFLAGRAMRVQLPAQAIVRWTADRWATYAEVEARDTNLGCWVADLPTEIMRPGASIEWTAEYADAWEGQNYVVTCRAE